MKRMEILLDTRTLERNIRKGLISEKEVNSFLQSLPNRESDADKILLDTGKGASDSSNH